MFGTLKKETILEEISKIGNGQIFRLGYRTELPVKAEYRNNGMKITKFTESSVRIGVNYSHIARVIEKRAQLEQEVFSTRKSNYTWLIKNRVRHNSNTKKDYLYVSTFNKGHNTTTKYIISCPKEGIFVTADNIEDTPYKNCIINSYFTKKETPEVKNISFENIYKINSIEA